MNINIIRKEDGKTPIFNNTGIWYVGNTAAKQDVQATLSKGAGNGKGGVIDIAYSDFEKDTSGNPDYTKPKYEAKAESAFANVQMSSLNIADGVLHIQSNVAQNKADQFTVTTLTLGEDATLKIQVMYDPIFATATGTIGDKKIPVFYATTVLGTLTAEMIRI